jgi:hypothetical protein
MTDAEETVEEIEMLSVDELSFELRRRKRLEGALRVESASPFIVRVEDEAIEAIEG